MILRFSKLDITHITSRKLLQCIELLLQCSRHLARVFRGIAENECGGVIRRRKGRDSIYSVNPEKRILMMCI